MPDMLVKLYKLEQNWSFVQEQEKLGITIRKPIGPEKHYVMAWVKETFGSGWAAETDWLSQTGRFPALLPQNQKS